MHQNYQPGRNAQTLEIWGLTVSRENPPTKIDSHSDTEKALVGNNATEESFGRSSQGRILSNWFFMHLHSVLLQLAVERRFSNPQQPRGDHFVPGSFL